MGVKPGYDQELEALRREMLRMGRIVEASIHDAVQSLARQDGPLARKVVDGNELVERLEAEIEDKCMALISRRQPTDRDLRIIGTGLKITTDLKRMNDHAYEIARITLRIADQPLIKPLIDIPRMAFTAQKMVRDSLEAYVNLDIALAEQICLADGDVVNIYQQIFRELLTYMMEDARTISQATQLIFVARYLERIADHATNIAEWVIYLVSGQRRRKTIS